VRVKRETEKESSSESKGPLLLRNVNKRNTLQTDTEQKESRREQMDKIHKIDSINKEINLSLKRKVFKL
jgi:hypothetical protein